MWYTERFGNYGSTAPICQTGQRVTSATIKCNFYHCSFLALLFSLFLISLSILNFTFRFAGTLIRSSVFGFCAVLAARSRYANLPKLHLSVMLFKKN